MWQHLELASELESDLRDTVNWGRKSSIGFGVDFRINWIGDLTLSLLLKLSRRKLEP